MIPEKKAMLRVASVIEDKMHSLGWDQPSVLGLVMEASDTELATVLYPIQPDDMPFQNPAAALMHLAELTEHMAATGKLPPAEVADFTAGIWFVMEAWSLDPRLKKEGVANADTPGALECRAVAMVDCAGRLYRAERIRGKDPHAWMPELGGLEEKTRVFVGLRRLLGALGTTMSAGSVDIGAVTLR